jgi:hypothetical protein
MIEVKQGELAGEVQVLSSPECQFATTEPTRNDVGLNLGWSNEKLTTECLNYGTVCSGLAT